MIKVVLLAFYLFALTLVPCADEGAHIPSGQAKIELHKQEAEKDHQHDVCSALCACSCCGIMSNIHGISVFVFTIKDSYRSFKIPQITDRFEGYIISVWQPPKFKLTL